MSLPSLAVHQICLSKELAIVDLNNDGIVFVEMATGSLSAVETTPDEELEAAVKAAGYIHVPENSSHP